MGKPAAPLSLSQTERRILEALLESKQVAKRVKRRARILLFAAEGLANSVIGQKLRIGRAYVLLWRKRFGEKGIRGLWETKGSPLPRVAQEIENELVIDALYQNYPLERALQAGAMRWTTRDLGKRYGVSHATAARILKCHGIAFDRRWIVDVSKLKISEDILFGVSISGVAGLFYDRAGPTLALSSSNSISPLADRTRWEVDYEARQLLQELQELGNRPFFPTQSAAAYIDRSQEET